MQNFGISQNSSLWFCFRKKTVKKNTLNKQKQELDMNYRRPEQMGFIDKQNSRTEQQKNFSWKCALIKCVGHLVVLGLETTVLLLVIKPNIFPNLDTPTNTTTNATTNNSNMTLNNSYTNAAISYSVFYILSLLVTISYWAFTYKKGRFPIGVTLLLVFLFDLPVMTSEVHLMKSQGINITWERNVWDLCLLLAFLLNALVQASVEIWTLLHTKRLTKAVSRCNKCCRKISIIISLFFCAVFAVSVVACAIYAPLFWLLLGKPSLTPVNMDHVGDILPTSTQTQTAVYILLLVGYVGQWALGLIVVSLCTGIWGIVVYYFCC